MITVEIFIRGLTQNDKEFIIQIMQAVNISNFNIHDINVENTDQLDIEIGIAIGTVCSRMIKARIQNLFILPSLQKLKPQESNRTTRNEAWKILQKIKSYTEGVKDNLNTDSNWQYATVFLPGQKKIVIYEKVKPENVQADIFISKKDSQLLLDIQKAFNAEGVIIGEESI